MSGLAHLDLDVLFGRSEGGYQAQILRSPAGDGQSVTFTRPFTDLELENFVLKVGRFRARTRRVEPAPVAAAKLFGGKLFDAVFTGTVGDCLRRSLDRAQQEQATLRRRIRLRFSGCSELADLPWELLYDRGDDWFLALSDRTPVVRYVQLPVQPRAVHVTLPAARRERITAIITSQPPREWSGHDLAILLGVKPRNMLTQLGEWARLGFFTRTGFGTYKLNTPASKDILDKPARPLTSNFAALLRQGDGRKRPPLTPEIPAAAAGLTARARPKARPGTRGEPSQPPVTLAALPGQSACLPACLLSCA